MQKVRLEELGDFARQILKKIKQTPQENGAYLLALSGNLGAGKTTFMQALAKALGVEGVVQSPTYVLMKSYEISQGNALAPNLSKASPFRKLIHIDAYRLNTPEEFQTLKPEEFLRDSRNLVCVEWPERLAGVLPKPDLTLSFSSDPPLGETEGVASDDSRYIEVV
ncbi:MAG: tRNA (adenosine(37)-N6)-threonylcarbamoyltransferase complex ATPase subunit type 1 TsaE [bacterium]